MYTYTANFNGRKLHAIGITYPIQTIVRGETVNKAKLALSDRFEHIRNLILTLQNNPLEK